jgi:hypothetical protein
VENVLKIAVDPLFPPPSIVFFYSAYLKWNRSKWHYAPENPYENNKFDLIFDELFEGQ